MINTVKENKAELIHLPVELDENRALISGRIYSTGVSRSQMWWKPLYAPTGAINDMLSARSGASPKDVLVVEDEAYLCDLIADVLASDGHITRTASNGREALALLEERKPQLILLDLMMPIMDGWEFMSRMQSHPEWRDIPVIIVTAIYDARRTQQEIGAKAVLTKPFDIDQITELVNLYAA